MQMRGSGEVYDEDCHNCIKKVFLQNTSYKTSYKTSIFTSRLVKIGISGLKLAYKL